MLAGTISTAEVRELVARDAAVRLIDCRESDEWDYCRLAGAELIPLSTFEVSAEAQLPNREATVIIYCHHGVRSAYAANFLAQRGYANVLNLAGGIDAWSREVDPTVARY